MKLQDVLSEDWRADAEGRRVNAAAQMQAAGTHTSPRNISQERWDDLVRKFGIDAAREEDLSVEKTTATVIHTSNSFAIKPMNVG